MEPQAIELLEVVALTEDLHKHGLVRGQVGTVVELLPPDAFEVEFCQNDGKPYAFLALKASQLMVLYHEPVEAA